MRVAFIFILVLCANSCAIAAENKKPNGEELFDLLLSSLSIPLNKEPLCDMTYFSRKDTPITLGLHLSTVLAASFDSKNHISIKSDCMRSKHDMDTGKVMEVWDCSVSILELNDKKEFISSSTTAFAVTLDKSKIVPGSLRCT